MLKTIPLALIFILTLLIFSGSSNANAIQNSALCREFNNQRITNNYSFPNSYNLGFVANKSPFRYSKNLISYQSARVVEIQEQLCTTELSDDEEEKLLNQLDYVSIISESVTLKTISSRPKGKKENYRIGKGISRKKSWEWQISFRSFGKEGFTASYRYAGKKTVDIQFNFYKKSLSQACRLSVKDLKSLRFGRNKISTKKLPGCSKITSIYRNKYMPSTNPTFEV